MSISIRELQKRKEELLEQYHLECRKIDKEIESIRKKRGTKLKPLDWSGYFEEGRDQPRRNGNW